MFDVIENGTNKFNVGTDMAPMAPINLRVAPMEQ